MRHCIIVSSPETLSNNISGIKKGDIINEEHFVPQNKDFKAQNGFVIIINYYKTAQSTILSEKLLTLFCNYVNIII
jgi:hypothetical protein